MKNYKLRYLPLFEDDLYEAVSYITDVLHNPRAAEKLIEETENAILERQKMPLAFEPYHSAKNRKSTYYRIYVGNYTVFYVVIDDIMEVRRFIYSGRDLDRLL
ncbi:MAG: type II toxin-antitoxin system RelE/ParE family toxin [Bacteroides sp.]|nr:type II toxin-antitoxin system RelE/ParE family toxin [Eubacterium sp.]MCM1419400.1 type II toxin-antitoxin system RelE/ParE family toxin [Roseburia sp.]MCM1463244.1 type II toxin-antitoxin system RelE/ParE family toxin [Bacteroides sp.]